MISRKLVLSFPPSLVDKLIIYRLVKEHDLEFNILKAAVTQNEEGMLIMELTGEKENYERGINYLKETGVHIQPLSKDVIFVEEKCTSCGACVPQCPTAAFVVEPVSRKILFYEERCIACEICVKVCPYKAMKMRW
ncbi:4Fe-4S binding protein [Candidatus Sumerlaeota bacterium]|nr:4Fe-4S binding protein [Candidatus Sumerlaeota bacterium]